MSLHAALQAVFIKGREQVRVSDVEAAAKRKISKEEQLAYQKAGVFMTTFSVIYNYDSNAAAPETIDVEETSTQKLAKKIRPKTTGIGRDAILQRYQDAGVDPTKYLALDNGRLAMVLSNLLRGRARREKASTSS